MIESAEIAKPDPVLISRNDLVAPEGSHPLADPRYHEIVSGVQVRARFLLASAGSVRRVDAWAADAGLVLHAFVEDLDAPSGATMAAGGLAALALARLVGFHSTSTGAGAATEPLSFRDVDALISDVARGEVLGAAGTSANAVVIGIHETGAAGSLSVALLHAGSTSWCSHDPAGPVELGTGDYVGLWSAVARVVAPVGG